MRVRICRQPTGTREGVAFENYRIGAVYDVGAQLAARFVAEGWAELADTEEHATSPGLSALVLIVDDDVAFRQLTSTVLSSNGYRVVEAGDGHQALGRLTAHTPDLVVLDLNMPVMDGWEFRAAQQRLANAQLATVPVLLLTGEDGADGHAESLCAVGLVRKPFDPEHLLVTIKAALAR